MELKDRLNDLVKSLYHGYVNKRAQKMCNFVLMLYQKQSGAQENYFSEDPKIGEVSAGVIPIGMGKGKVAVAYSPSKEYKKTFKYISTPVVIIDAIKRIYYPKWYEKEEKRYVIPEELISNTENVMKALRLKRIEE